MCPPAQLQILQQEFHTQKQVRTIQSLRVFILYSCRCVNRAHVMPLTADCYFRHWLSTGRYSWYFLRVWEVGLHRGCAFCGAMFRIIIQNSRAWAACPSGQRCQWSSYHLPPLCISVKMICQLSITLFSLQKMNTHTKNNPDLSINVIKFELLFLNDKV